MERNLKMVLNTLILLQKTVRREFREIVRSLSQARVSIDIVKNSRRK